MPESKTSVALVVVVSPVALASVLSAAVILYTTSVRSCMVAVAVPTEVRQRTSMASLAPTPVTLAWVATGKDVAGMDPSV